MTSRTNLDRVSTDLHHKTSEAGNLRLENDRLQVVIFPFSHSTHLLVFAPNSTLLLLFILQPLNIPASNLFSFLFSCPKTDLPTSTFFVVLVVFFKGKYGSTFFSWKICLFFFLFLFFSFFLFIFFLFSFFFFLVFFPPPPPPWRVKVLHYTHYLWKLGQSFWIMFKNKAKIAPESTLKPVCFQGP